MPLKSIVMYVINSRAVNSSIILRVYTLERKDFFQCYYFQVLWCDDDMKRVRGKNPLESQVSIYAHKKDLVCKNAIKYLFSNPLESLFKSGEEEEENIIYAGIVGVKGESQI